MTDSGRAREPESAMKPEMTERERSLGPIEEYARGEIRAYHGIVNKWLLAVYAILAIWGIYYLFVYWGGLGRLAR